MEFLKSSRSRRHTRDALVGAVRWFFTAGLRRRFDIQLESIESGCVSLL